VTDHSEHARVRAVASRRPPSPFRLSLEQQKKRAKELLHGLRAGAADARSRFRRHHPEGQSISEGAASDRLAHLSEAQLVIARELGLPSWARLKAHIAAMQQARERIDGGTDAADRDRPTLHIRCGSDIGPVLKEAGFGGDFLEYSDPFCQGPVVKDADWLARRAAFLTRAYELTVGRGGEQITFNLETAEARLQSAARDYERVVLWLEHDSYDQLVLARCLAQFAEMPVRRLELISVDRFPGSVRFVGLGQLPPEALSLLWRERRPLSQRQVLAGGVIWDLLRAPDPTALAQAANVELDGLPHLPRAIRRHCEELPWVRDGLSLTERLVLELIAERPRTVGEVFRDLTLEREPLPWLGDTMLWFVVESMKRVREPVFTGAFADGDRRWAREWLTITEVGRAVLAGAVDWLSLAPPERWLGGVQIQPAAPCWRWDPQMARPVLRR